MAGDFSCFAREFGALFWGGLALFVGEEGLALGGYAGGLPLGGLGED